MEGPYVIELNRPGFGLKFRNRRLEGEFRGYAAARDCAGLRLQLALAAALICLVTGMDHYLLDPDIARTASIFRGAIMLPPVIAMFLLTFVPSARGYLQLAAVGVGLAVGLTTLAIGVLYGGSGESPAFAGFEVVTIFVYFFLGLRFPFALGTATVLLCSYIVVAVSGPATPVVAAYNGVYLLFLNVIGAIGAYQVQKVGRTRFLEERILGYRANHDAVTHLPNRRAFDEFLVVTWENAKLKRCPVAALMIDIDHFKNYNDLYGHQAGDFALHDVAQIIESSLRRPQDFAGRYGGEEFVVLLYDTTPDFAMNYGESLRRQLLDKNIRHQRSATGDRISISVGIAHLEPATSGRSPQGFVQLADEALYAAKEAGRNCVQMSSRSRAETGKTGVFKVLKLSDSQLMTAMSADPRGDVLAEPQPES